MSLLFKIFLILFWRVGFPVKSRLFIFVFTFKSSDRSIKNFPLWGNFSNACLVRANSRKEFGKCKLGKASHFFAKQDAEYKGVQRYIPPRPRSEDCGQTRHWSRQSSHQKVQQSRNLVSLPLSYLLRIRFANLTSGVLIHT